VVPVISVAVAAAVADTFTLRDIHIVREHPQLLQLVLEGTVEQIIQEQVFMPQVEQTHLLEVHTLQLVAEVVEAMAVQHKMVTMVDQVVEVETKAVLQILVMVAQLQVDKVMAVVIPVAVVVAKYQVVVAVAPVVPGQVDHQVTVEAVITDHSIREVGVTGFEIQFPAEGVFNVVGVAWEPTRLLITVLQVHRIYALQMAWVVDKLLTVAEVNVK